VLSDLDGCIDLLIDGGEIVYGLESTVIDLTSDPPVVLRPGPITLESLRGVLGDVNLHPGALGHPSEDEAIARSPGMKYRHYAPRAQLVVVEGSPERIPFKIRELVREHKRRGLRVGAIVTAEHADIDYAADVLKIVGDRRNPRSIARNLFRVLRELDAEGVEWAVIEGVEPRGIGLAIMNRLKKAAGHRVVRV
jgi:L-threonylcarbamoyladenylate synthase